MSASTWSTLPVGLWSIIIEYVINDASRDKYLIYNKKNRFQVLPIVAALGMTCRTFYHLVKEYCHNNDIYKLYTLRVNVAPNYVVLNNSNVLARINPNYTTYTIAYKNIRKFGTMAMGIYFPSNVIIQKIKTSCNLNGRYIKYTIKKFTQSNYYEVFTRETTSIKYVEEDSLHSLTGNPSIRISFTYYGSYDLTIGENNAFGLNSSHLRDICKKYIKTKLPFVDDIQRIIAHKRNHVYMEANTAVKMNAVPKITIIGKPCNNLTLADMIDYKIAKTYGKFPIDHRCNDTILRKRNKRDRRMIKNKPK